VPLRHEAVLGQPGADPIRVVRRDAEDLLDDAAADTLVGQALDLIAHLIHGQQHVTEPGQTDAPPTRGLGSGRRG
jgi:hypothetical protein